MKKLAFVVLALAIFPHAGRADESYVDSLKHSRWLSPEICSSMSPEDLYNLRLNEDPRRMDVSSSEAGQDGFFEAYADNLAVYNNKHYPLAKRIRPHLQAAFAQIFEFISDANGHNGVRHYDLRLPAWVEWRITDGFRDHFEAVDGQFSIKDIRDIAQIYQRAHAEAGSPDAAKSANEHLEAGLRELHAAEALMSDDASTYFRARIMGMFGEFLRP
jgi:hypothetical protein